MTADVETTTCTWSYTPSEIPTGAGSAAVPPGTGGRSDLLRRQGGPLGQLLGAQTFEQLRNDPGMGRNQLVAGIGEAVYRWFGKYEVGEAGVGFLKANRTVRVTYGGNDVDASG